MTKPYTIGDQVRVRAKFKNIAGRLADPVAMKFSVRSPAGLTTYTMPAPQIVREATGIYYVDVDATAAGDWYYRFAATGTVQAAKEGKFVVQPSSVL